MVAGVVVTLSSLQALLRRKRQSEQGGPTHLSHSSLPGAISVKGSPKTLIQVNQFCESQGSQREKKPIAGGGGGWFFVVAAAAKRSSKALVIGELLYMLAKEKTPHCLPTT